MPGDTVLSTPDASIDAISARTRLQCVTSWLQTVTDRRYALEPLKGLTGRVANQCVLSSSLNAPRRQSPEALA
jgi:hypothetical protein